VFKDVSELKEFIIWAKSQKIQALKVGEVEVHFGAGALIDSSAINDALLGSEEQPAPVTEEQVKALKKEELDILFHSSI
jgi:hypothetical protein